MRRVPKPPSGALDPGPGLRALAELVLAAINDARRGLGTARAFAGAGAPVLMAIDAPQSTPQLAGSPAQRTARRPRPAPVLPAESPDLDVAAEHTETWDLVTRAQAGDGEAFGQLYDRYVDTVFRFIYFRVNDRGLAEDFTSETFLRALRRIGTISYQGRDIGAWFVTIARNIVLDHLKSARHRLEVTTADTLEGDDREPGPEAAVIGSLTSERLMQAVRQLGDEQRECILLRFIQGFSVSETAAAMGKNDGAIKALQHRAVRKLADLVGGDLR